MSSKVNDDGHEPQGLDETLVQSELRKGGALIRLRVERGSAAYVAEALVTASEIATTKMGSDFLIRSHITRLAAAFSGVPDKAKSGPGIGGS